MSRLAITTTGYPSIGRKREVKFAMEHYLTETKTFAQVLEVCTLIQKEDLKEQNEAGVETIAVGEHTAYDIVADTLFTLGLVPQRYENLKRHLEKDRSLSAVEVQGKLYAAMARGSHVGEIRSTPMALSKWFATNYHYLVPEISDECIESAKNSASFYTLDVGVDAARALALEKLIALQIIGPVTISYLGCSTSQSGGSQWAAKLAPLYEGFADYCIKNTILKVQLWEPALCLERIASTSAARTALKLTIDILAKRGIKVCLVTTYGHVAGILSDAARFPGLQSIALDAEFPENAKALAQIAQSTGGASIEIKEIIVGCVRAQSPARVKEEETAALARIAHAIAGSSPNAMADIQIHIAPTCTLMHLPYDICAEMDSNLPCSSGTVPTELFTRKCSILKDLINNKNIGFAKQKLEDLAEMSKINIEKLLEIARNNMENREEFADNTKTDTPPEYSLEEVARSFWRNVPLHTRMSQCMTHSSRISSMATTTIGSLPQTTTLRRARAEARQGSLGVTEYEDIIHAYIKQSIEFQETIDLDILVHGEPERSDMVEYFAELLEGLIPTNNGWARSYGTRCVRPPLIVGPVAPASHSVDAFMSIYNFTTKQTSRPVKGILTGPCTILKWSFFARTDASTADATRHEIGEALHPFVMALERAGCEHIQIDEPALKEGLPLQCQAQHTYCVQTAGAFRRVVRDVAPTTRIWSHICYSELGDIIPLILDMEPDALCLETSRGHDSVGPLRPPPSVVKLIAAGYEGHVGLGLFDVHSTNTPSVQTMIGLVKVVITSGVAPYRLFLSPDCGLKTRMWDEVSRQLAAMKDAANTVLREYYST